MGEKIGLVIIAIGVNAIMFTEDFDLLFPFNSCYKDDAGIIVKASERTKTVSCQPDGNLFPKFWCE